MNILFVAPGFLEKRKPISGMPAYIYRMSKSLLAMGHTPCIVCGGDKTKTEFYDDIEVHRINTEPLLGDSDFNLFFLNNLRRDFLLQLEIRNICKAKKMDIIQYAGNAGTGIFHGVKIPAVMRLSSYYKITYASNLTYSKRQVSLCSYLERAAAKRMNAVYAPSRALADPFGQELNRKIQVIETPFFDETVNQDESVWEKELKGKKYFLYFGAIYPDKGVLIIADLAQKIFAEFPEYYLVFVGQDCYFRGDSTMKKVLKCIGLSKEKFIHINSLPHQQLYPIIKYAKLVLLPSMMENLSNSCMEAMYFEKVVIGTNGASYEQLIDDGKSGYLFKKGDSNNLFFKIKEAMQMNDKEFQKMGKRAKKRIERLDPEKSISRTLRYYDYIINNW